MDSERCEVERLETNKRMESTKRAWLLRRSVAQANWADGARATEGTGTCSGPRREAGTIVCNQRSLLMAGIGLRPDIYTVLNSIHLEFSRRSYLFFHLAIGARAHRKRIYTWYVHGGVFHPMSTR